MDIAQLILDAQLTPPPKPKRKTSEPRECRQCGEVKQFQAFRSRATTCRKCENANRRKSRKSPVPALMWWQKHTWWRIPSHPKYGITAGFNIFRIDSPKMFHVYSSPKGIYYHVSTARVYLYEIIAEIAGKEPDQIGRTKWQQDES